MKKYINNERNDNKNCNFFGNADEYDFFVKDMMEAAEEDNLPAAFEHTAPMRLSMNDVKTFSQAFKNDTGLDINFQVYTCDNCDRLHLVMVVDNKE